jgi:hypothetical protein
VHVDAALQETYAGQVLQTRVRLCDSLRTAPVQRGTIFECDPLSHGAYDYAFLTEEIEGPGA